MSAQETLLNNRYRLIAQQGSGGMAVIYKAVDQALGRTVAVKILRPSLITDPSFLERFRNEARSVAKLTHPNIVTVHDVGQDGNTHYIVMEFLEGQDLKKVIRTEAPFSIERALDIAIKVCAGVGYAHRSGLVHADVKPQNVLITRDSVVKVTDFGIAQALSDAAIGAERQKVVWGSPHYFSPEQAQGERPSPASDVYSIGIVLFEMLTGRLPFIGADQQELALSHIRDDPPQVTDFNPSVPVQLEQIIQKVMSKEPASRYRTADQLGRILISYRRQGSRPTGDISVPVSPADPPASPPGDIPAASSGSMPTQPAQQAVVPAQSPVPAPYQPAAMVPQGHTPMPYPVGAQPTPPPPRSVEPEEQVNNLVTIILAIVALIAVMGLIPLGLTVLAAYQSVP
jgi:serine/threonine protein kinase